jgi:regulatory protein
MTVKGGRIAFNCKVGVDPDVPVEHAQILFNMVHEPGAQAGGPVLRGPFCLMVLDCGTNMAMASRSPRKARPTLTAEKLEELALNYVGRFATSRSKLLAYLHRKLRERGWHDESEPPIEELANRMVKLGYIDDRAFALSKARSLTGRGYGERRVRQALMIAGIDEEQGADARQLAEEEAVAAALKFASRRSIGPYRSSAPTPQERERAIAAMVRAGHRFALAKAITDLNPGENPDSTILFNMR